MIDIPPYNKEIGRFLYDFMRYDLGFASLVKPMDAKYLYFALRKELSKQQNSTPQEVKQPEENVVRVRGSYDAPGFEVCVREEMARLLRVAAKENNGWLPIESAPKVLWLWKNFVNGQPEYWAFDNKFPVNMDNEDPQTLGEPCGYAIFKQSRCAPPKTGDE